MNKKQIWMLAATLVLPGRSDGCEHLAKLFTFGLDLTSERSLSQHILGGG